MKKLTTKEKEILNNYNSFFKIDEERNSLDTGRVINAKPNLDDYDNMGYVDNSTNDVDFGLDNYDNYNMGSEE